MLTEMVCAAVEGGKPGKWFVRQAFLLEYGPGTSPTKPYALCSMQSVHCMNKSSSSPESGPSIAGIPSSWRIMV